MDEVIGLLVEALVKRARGGSEPAARKPPASTPKPPAVNPKPSAQAVPAPSLPAPVPRAASTTRLNTPRRATPASPVDADDPFAAVAAVPAVAPAARALLADFSGRDSLLAGIVLAEALAPPLALRDNSFPLGRVEHL